MTQPGMHEPNAHPAALLLPWYAIGVLDERERVQVEEHLATCASCRAELETLRELRGHLREAYSDEPVPSSAAFRAVRARIGEAREATSGGLFDGIANALRWLLIPKWAPTAALVLIVAQLGALMWLAQRAPDAGAVTTRGIPSPVTQLSVIFEPKATEQGIRDLLLEVHARIVSGPSPDGAYVLEVPTTDPQRVEQRLATLRARPELVRSVEKVGP
jgi:anti-sigma-K factor RskA